MKQLQDCLQVIAVDIGGSSIKSAAIGPAGHLAGQPMTTLIDSQADTDTILRTFAGAIRQHLTEVGASSLLGVAIGCPGPFDYQAGISYIKGVAKYESIYGVDVRRCRSSSATTQRPRSSARHCMARVAPTAG
jgi:glucokinase